MPGTSEDERRRLAALGGLAQALAGAQSTTWPDPLRQWAESAPCLPRVLTDEIRSRLSCGEDILASIYQRLVSGRSRRHLGTFFTPPAIVEFLLDQAQSLIGTPDLVIDPGAGVGAITVAAHRRWPSARIIAVDLNLVTLGLLAAHCAAQEIEGVELVLDDYLPKFGPN